MWAPRVISRRLLSPLPLLHNRVLLGREIPLHCNTENEIISECRTAPIYRLMSTIRGRSMRSKVEKRMQRETGKTMREMRRAKKLRKKLMTEEERLIYNLRRAKKKVALLLQKLKKYELPDLPAPKHDPELLTPEQLQAYKKIGFKNRNYVPVGVRGVFGGVVLNMHLHWKFHETVQVCCDNFPKEKIKEMASMLARLSGGIVINIHNVKTIIMFRGRNYRQPKIMTPINTLTKRKALFKARFEQALESQKLNIKKIEQQLRRKGVNPEDPIAMASIQRVASTFFRAIDDRQGTPYIFHGDARQPASDGSVEEDDNHQTPTDLSPEDSDQEELDQFIADIEDAADQEWEEEEAAEREESSKIRYWDKEEVGTMRSRSSNWRKNDLEGDRNMGRGNMQRTMNIRKWDSDSEVSDAADGQLEDSDIEVDEDDSRAKVRDTRPRKGRDVRKMQKLSDGSESEMFFGSEDDGLWESDDDGKECGSRASKLVAYDYHSGSEFSEEEGSVSNNTSTGKIAYDYHSGSEDSNEESGSSNNRNRSRPVDDSEMKKIDENWDSD